mmetsp:Transcript_28842/g.33131  ORF Transcript_28842/g.33131 Transcript_28842/m.33131 type:complete len:127 (-) Transcript_28842:175-555(-)
MQIQVFHLLALLLRVQLQVQLPHLLRLLLTRVTPTGSPSTSNRLVLHHLLVQVNNHNQHQRIFQRVHLHRHKHLNQQRYHPSVTPSVLSEPTSSISISAGPSFTPIFLDTPAPSSEPSVMLTVRIL